MKKLFPLIFVLFSIFSFPSLSETLTLDDFVIRDEIYYKKFTNTPYTGGFKGIEYGYFIKGMLKDGKKVGKWETNKENGDLWKIDNYIDGRLEGLSKTFINGSNLYSEGNIKNNKKIGIWLWYYGNGQLNFLKTYKNGMLDGEWKEYFQNGKLKEKGKYVLGKKQGTWIKNYENGQLMGKSEFLKGKRNGLTIAYYENGKLSGSCEAINDLREGPCIVYNEDGTKNKEFSGIFRKDKKISD